MTRRRFDLIAARKLLFSPVDSQERTVFEIKIGRPYELEEGDVSFAFADGTAACDLMFDGLGEESMTMYGADTMQALEIALQFDTTLRRLSTKYAFFYLDGEPYFDDEGA